MKRIVFDVPRWSCYLHRDARGLDAIGVDDGAIRRFEDELFERLYVGKVDRLPVELVDAQLGEWAKKVHGECEQLPAFGRLAAECLGDADAAGMGVEALIDELRPRLDRDGQAPDIRRAIRVGSEKGSVAVEDLREAVEGLAHVGTREDASPPSTTASRARRLARKLKDDARLRRIAMLAGRFKRIAAAKRRQKVRHGADEISDIEQGADLARLLPVELAKLIHPKLHLVALRDLAERKSLQYALSGTETLGKGPLVVCTDKSGSMDGDPDTWATAVALALLDTAQRERRPFALLGFDDGVKFEAVVMPGEALPEAGLFVGCSGGTDIGGVVRRALDIIEQHPGALKTADVVLVTDGASSTSTAPELRARAAALGVTILGVGIGVPRDALEPWSDETQVVSTTATLDDSTAGALFGGGVSP